MKALLYAIVAFYLSASVSALAQTLNVPQNFDAQKWSLLKDKILQDGKYQYVGTILIFYLEQINPSDTSKAHQADYLSAQVAVDSEGNSVIVEMSDVSETWTVLSDGNFDIDQWIYKIDPNGNFYEVEHSDLVESPDGLVLQLKGFPTGKATDPAVLADYGEKLAQWYQMLNPSPAPTPAPAKP